MLFDNIYDGKIDTWDYQWTFSCWAQNGLSILPDRNLVTNIGFGTDATHTEDYNSVMSNLRLESMVFPSYSSTMHCAGCCGRYME